MFFLIPVILLIFGGFVKNRNSNEKKRTKKRSALQDQPANGECLNEPDILEMDEYKQEVEEQ